jgi:two-component system chemotaxis response regulator CheY
VSLNLLVVDDSAVMRAMIIKTLRLSGVELGELFQAGNGLEGLKVLEANHVDLVLVDINMPVMNGEEMIDRMKENPEMKDIPVVVISTEGSKARIESLQHKGATFIHKPFSPETIRDTAKHLLKMEGSDDRTDS